MPQLISLAKRLLAVMCSGLCASSLYAGPAETPTEDLAQLRSAHVAQVVQGIINYARWQQPPQPLNLCIVAPTEYADLLWKNPPESSRYPIKVKRVLVEDLQLENQCHAIYLGVMDSGQRQALFSRLIGRPVLTISENQSACSEGSLFCLRIVDEHVGFQVNLDAVARSGIRIHPNVLKLGKRAGAQP